MLKVRTFCLALLIPLLLDLLVFFTAQPTRENSSTRIKQGCEEVQEGFRELEECSEEEEEEEFSFGGLLAASLLRFDCRDFHALEPATVRLFLLPARSFGWKMPLRI